MKTIVTVEGMMCNHCEDFVNKSIRKAFEVTDVQSSYKEKKTVIVSEQPLDAEKVMDVIRKAGYEPKEVKTEK